jgi:hypothetical protein
MNGRNSSANEQAEISMAARCALFFLLGVLCVLVGNLLAPARKRASASKAAAAVTAATSPTLRWGVLHAERIPLQNFDMIFPNGCARLNPSRWYFGDCTPEAVQEILRGCALTRDQEEAWLDTNRWHFVSNSIVVTPTDELAAKLSHEGRQRLYPILARWRVNYPQQMCYKFPIGGLKERLHDSGLPDEVVELVREQSFTNDGSLCLCIDGAFQTQLATNEFNQLLKALWMVRSWDLSVEVTPASDIGELTRYWGHGGCEAAIRPLLESVAQSGGGKVSVASLLPSFARQRLFLYPDNTVERGAFQQDCFYTALNFFHDQPDARYERGDAAASALREDYEKARDDWQLGDLLLLLDAQGMTVHICVYLAGDFVFTKDGTGPIRPWVIMRIPDVLADYPAEPPLRQVHLRHKGSPGGA